MRFAAPDFAPRLSSHAGFIPLAGDVIDAGLNYILVVRPATKLDIPQSLLTKMLVNNAISAGVGWVSQPYELTALSLASYPSWEISVWPHGKPTPVMPICA